ncbi:MAG: protein kinase [Candidatus Aminicenantes bacterium]|jgi:serine/threonine protein kinase
MIKNPYHYNGPLEPEKDKLVLIPRNDALNSVVKGINKGDFWAIFGPREIGKTTFLRQLAHRLDNSTYTLSFNLQVSPKSAKTFYQSIIERLIDKIPSKKGDIKRKYHDLPHGFLDFLEDFKPRENKKILLLFDEIEGVPSVKDFLKLWRTVYNDRYHKKEFKKYSIVLTGSSELLSLTTGRTSPFNISEQLYMKDFSDEESERLIRIPLKTLNIKIESKAKTTLISQIKGHPQMLQQACYELVELALKEKKGIWEEDIESAINVLFKRNTAIDLLKYELKKDNKLKKLIKNILKGAKKTYHLYKEYSIAGAGCIIEDVNSHCAIRNKVYEKFLADSLDIPLEEKIPPPEEKIESIEKDSYQRFNIMEKIGKGGVGVVYKAKDNVLDRMVAIKELNRELAENRDDFNKVIREARTTARLLHKNIVRVYDIKKIKNNHIIIMEFVEGEDYSQIIHQQGPLPVPEIITVARELFEALHYSHSQGIIHKDIKPKNIMKDRSGEIKIVDFGVAAIGATEKHNLGYIIGSPHYISPEQITRSKPDHRSDIYSAGATLFHLATGQVMFTGKNVDEIFRKHVFDPPPSINKIRPEIPKKLAHIIEKCLEKEKEDRFQSAKEVLEQIKKIEDTIKKQVNRKNKPGVKPQSKNSPDGTDITQVLKESPFEEANDD